MIDLPQTQLKLVKEILSRQVPNLEVRVFGSRITGEAKPYSDLDLVIVGNVELPQDVYYRLKDSFEESTLPIRIEVLDWHRISAEFRRVIEQNYQIIQASK
jgi:predicted nucleotidyltransferase